MKRDAAKRANRRDVLDVIEQAYRLDAAPRAWLQEITTTVYGLTGRGLGCAAYFYRVTEDFRLEVGEDLTLGMSVAPPIPLGEALGMLPPEFVRKSFVRCECATQSQAMDDEMRAMTAPIREATESMFGARDILMLGGMDPTGHGVYVGTWLPEVTRLSASQRATWSRVAVHLVNALRLRRSVRAGEPTGSISQGADAVLTPGGKVEHAETEAQSRSARDALSSAVRLMESARGKLRRDDPDAAVDLWKGLVSCRWSLVEQFESDGRRYIVARRNDAQVGGFEALSDREKQALSYAALRHSNKLIAYEMGVSASTVGVLLHRAAKKLGVRSRSMLIEAYRSRNGSGSLQ